MNMEKGKGFTHANRLFWSLNGKLTEEGVRDRIKDFQEKGFGGFFLHARAGLRTEYVSEEWFSLLAVAVDGRGFTTSFTAVLACLNNVGPGLGEVGPMGSFAMLSPFTKYVLMFDMLAGRLELFPMLLLFAPGTWKR